MNNPRPAQVAEGSARCPIPRCRCTHLAHARATSSTCPDCTHDLMVRAAPTPTHRPARATTPQEGHQ